MASPAVEIPVGDRVVRVTNPDRVYFPATGWTKRDLVDYYLNVGDGIVRALRNRPCMLHRFPDGLAGPKVHQKRLPGGAPDWVQTVELWFPRYGRTADELCVTELAQVIWAVQMSTVEFHPWNSRRGHVEQPDEWRIDLDPMPEADFGTVTPASTGSAAGEAFVLPANTGSAAGDFSVISADVGISAAGEACVIPADAGISELAGRVIHSEKEHQISLWITVHVFETVRGGR